MSTGAWCKASASVHACSKRPWRCLESSTPKGEPRLASSPRGYAERIQTRRDCSSQPSMWPKQYRYDWTESGLNEAVSSEMCGWAGRCGGLCGSNLPGFDPAGPGRCDVGGHGGCLGPGPNVGDIEWPAYCL